MPHQPLHPSVPQSHPLKASPHPLTSLILLKPPQVPPASMHQPVWPGAEQPTEPHMSQPPSPHTTTPGSIPGEKRIPGGAAPALGHPQPRRAQAWHSWGRAPPSSAPAPGTSKAFPSPQTTQKIFSQCRQFKRQGLCCCWFGAHAHTARSRSHPVVPSWGCCSERGSSLSSGGLEQRYRVLCVGEGTGDLTEHDQGFPAPPHCPLEQYFPNSSKTKIKALSCRSSITCS